MFYICHVQRTKKIEVMYKFILIAMAVLAIYLSYEEYKGKNKS